MINEMGMGQVNIKINEIDFEYSEIFDITKRLITEYSYEEIFDKIINDYYFSGIFYTFLKSNKTYILEEVIDNYYKIHKNGLYEDSMKSFVDFLVKPKNYDLFRTSLVNFFKDDYLEELIKILFINKKDLENKFEEIKVILEDEKNILDKDLYRNILKEEFISSLKTI